MGLFDRLRGRDDDPHGRDDDPDAVSGTTGDETAGVEPVEEVGIRRLTADEESALAAVRAGYAAHGIDPADLETISAAYDRALDAHDCRAALAADDRLDGLALDPQGDAPLFAARVTLMNELLNACMLAPSFTPDAPPGAVPAL